MNESSLRRISPQELTPRGKPFRLALLLIIGLVNFTANAEWLTSRGITVWTKYSSAKREFQWTGSVDASGKANGTGVYTMYYKGNKVAQYTGTMLGGRMEGKVTAIYYKTNQRYQGELRDGSENGYGTMTYADGTSATGRWVDGQLVEVVGKETISSQGNNQVSNSPQVPNSPQLPNSRTVEPSNQNTLYRAAVINDRDGYTNIRADQNAASPVVAKVRREEVFYALPSSTSWWRVMDQNGHEGFMNSVHVAIIPGQRAAKTPADMKVDDTPSDPEEQDALGRKFTWGMGVPIDHQRAYYWFKKAADQGNLSAKASLAILYLDGKGVPKNADIAVDLLREGINQNNGRAEAFYAVYLLDNTKLDSGLTPKNIQLFGEVSQWLAKAASREGEDGARGTGALHQFTSGLDASYREFLLSQMFNALINSGRTESDQYMWGGVPVSREYLHDQLYFMDKRNGH